MTYGFTVNVVYDKKEEGGGGSLKLGLGFDVTSYLRLFNINCAISFTSVVSISLYLSFENQKW
jgi:hypothetical protein